MPDLKIMNSSNFLCKGTCFDIKSPSIHIFLKRKFIQQIKFVVQQFLLNKCQLNEWVGHEHKENYNFEILETQRQKGFVWAQVSSRDY